MGNTANQTIQTVDRIKNTVIDFLTAYGFNIVGALIILAIAIPFAVSGVRVSPAVGVSKSIGLFLLYYLLSSFATMLGGNGYMDPFWAAWLPNLLLGLTGLGLIWRAR